jgi:hypothetical protein
MKTSVFPLLIIALIFISGCKESEVTIIPHEYSNSDLIIKAGFVCGWGAGTDSIDITSTKISYNYYIPGRSLQPQIKKSRAVSESEWAEILNDVTISEFVKLQYQTCNVCADGCDEWIFIKNDTISHKITFGKGAKIVSISKLQDKLAQLRTEFSN